MADGPAPSTVERIDRALARIDAASKKLIASHGLTDRRNQVLRDTVADAVATLDTLIRQGRGDG